MIDVRNSRRVAFAPELDRHRVETQRQSPEAATRMHPGAGDLGDLALLAFRDGLQWMAEARSPSRLDLNEGHRVAAANDEIHLVAARAVVAFQHGPARVLEMSRGDRFALAPQLPVCGHE